MADKRDEYSLSVRFGEGCAEHGEYQIRHHRRKYDFDPPLVWSRPLAADDDISLSPPPPDVAAEYERLIGYKGEESSPPMNVVEMIADDEDSAFDQPCRWGHHIKSHAVYCHNTQWLYAPRKCRRTQGPSVWGGTAWPHEDCPGFSPNPLPDRRRGP